MSTNNDYVTNTFPRTFPKGLDVEVFDFTVLTHMWKNAILPSEREHVTQFLYNNKKFISTYGGKYLLNEDGYYEVVEFNSLDSSLVGDSVYFSNVSINQNDENGLMKLLMKLTKKLG